MRKQSTTLFPLLGQVQVESLTTIVKETLALNYETNEPKKKVFTAAELWNIQRQKKSMVQRRFMF